jgi:hypothetical protein
MRRERVPFAIFFCFATMFAASLSASAGESVEKGRRGSVEPLVDLLSVTASCSPLILPQAETEADEIRNEGARQAYRELRKVVETQINFCAGTEAAAASPIDEVLKQTGAVTVCGDCSDCLSAASCTGCVAGAVCSKPGATPTRACRVIKTCGTYSNGNIRACCGCS